MATETELGPRVERRHRRVGVGILELVPEHREDASLRTLIDNMHDRVCALLVAVITAAQFADVVTTFRALSAHSYVENNPIFRALIVRNPVSAYAVKLLAVSGMVLLVLSRLHGRRVQVALAIAAGLSLTAPLLNFLLLVRG
jgi:hypothetical protein